MFTMPLPSSRHTHVSHVRLHFLPAINALRVIVKPIELNYQSHVAQDLCSVGIKGTERMVFFKSSAVFL